MKHGALLLGAAISGFATLAVADVLDAANEHGRVPMQMEEVWSYDLEAPVVAQPCIAEVDGEPLLIVAASDGLVLAIDGGGREQWRSDVGGIPGTMSVVTLSGRPALVVGNDQGRLTAIGMDGSQLWDTAVCDFRRPEAWNRGMGASNGVVELRGSGSAALVVTDRSGALTALDAEGGIVWQAHLTSAGHFQCLGRPAVADLDGDGADEIVVSGFDGRAHCLSSTGEWRWSTEVMPAEGGYHSPLIVDWGDGPRVLLLGMRDGSLRCLDENGDDVWEFQGAGAVGIHLGLASVVIEGEPHILIAYNKSGLVLITTDGQRVWYREYQGGNQPSVPTVADIDGDGNPELMHVRSGNRTLWILDADGLVREEIELDAPVASPPIVCDFDGDGVPEFVTVEAANGHVSARKIVGARPGGAIQWPGSRGAFDGRGSSTFGMDLDRRDAAPVRRASPPTATLIREEPLTLVTGRQPIRYALEGGSADARALQVSVVGPDSIPHIYVRRPDDAVHGWVEPYRDGAYQLRATLYDSQARAIAELDESIEFTAFALERDRGAELLAGIDALLRDSEALDGVRRSARAAEDRWRGLLARMDSPDEDRERLAEEVGDHIFRLERLLACGERAVDVRERTGDPVDLLAWQIEHPWAPFDPASAAPPEALPGELRVTTEQRSHEATVVAIANVTGRPLDIRVTLDGWHGGEDPPARDAVTLRRVVTVPTARQNMSPDALPALDEAGILAIPADESAQLWIDWASKDVAPGEHTAELSIRALTVAGQVWSMPLVWEVLPVALPEQMPLWFHVWAYHNPLLGDDDAIWQDLVDHHMNVFDLPLPRAVYDSHGELGPIDWSATDRVIARAPEGSFYLWHGGEGFVAAGEGVPGVGSEPWRQAYERFAHLWLEHLAAQGIDSDRHANYIIDEPGIYGGKNVDYFDRIAPIWRSIDPQVRIYCNPGGGATREHVERIVRNADVLGPNWGEYRGVPDVYHAEGETIPAATEPNDYVGTICEDAWMVWTYRCDGGVKDLRRMTYYWEPIWQGPRFRLTGLGFWSYAGRQTDFWQGPNPNDTDYELVYTGASGPVPSRRWQGLRLGIEDDARLRMVLNAADRARDRGNDELADRLARRREQLIERVLESGVDEGVVAEVRAELRTILVEEAGE